MEFRTYFVYFHTFSNKFKVQRTPTEFGVPVPRLACDHALSLYRCNLFPGGWHDTIFSQITAKKAESGLVSLFLSFFLPFFIYFASPN